ncbi:hypothetical protein CPC08DRAFT_769564 [Agrocybe pediades]|nr:hypothetical protein CPC08DRAFT_769564 [Agrocybe pediades]
MAMDSLAMNATEETSILQSLRLRKQFALAMLSILLYEYAVTTYVQERILAYLEPLNVVLGVYLYSRYFALTFQVSTLSSSHLRAQMLCLDCFPGGIHDIVGYGSGHYLMLRIYALYLKSVRIGFFLGFLLMGTLITTIVLGPLGVFDVRYNSLCEPLHMHPSFKYLGVAGGVLHIWLAILTAAKWNLAKMGIPVAKLVARDSAWTITLVFVLLAFLFPYSIRSNGAKAEINFICPTTLISIATCRVIMNMRSLAFLEETATTTAGLRLTGDLDMIYLEQLNVTYRVNGAS